MIYSLNLVHVDGFDFHNENMFFDDVQDFRYPRRFKITDVKGVR